MTADPAELAAFGRRYRRFLRLASLVPILPMYWRLDAARMLGRWASPYRLKAKPLAEAMAAALDYDAAATRQALDDWLANHGLAAATLFAFTPGRRGWLERLVHVADATMLAELASNPGLVLTAHCQHQNLLAAWLGRACGNMNPLAASAEQSPLYPWIGPYIDRLNRDSAAWFGTGRYLFLDRRHGALRTMHALLETGGWVLALCDTHAPSADAGPAGQLFGRRIQPPQGAIRAAIRHRRPIYAGLMTPEAHGLSLHLVRLAGVSPAQVVSEYCQFLESHLRLRPEAWQGWEWWPSLPPA